MSCRGLAANDSQDTLFSVHGNKLYQVDKNGERTVRGTLQSRNGYVDIRIGTSQLVMVDGANLYVLNLTTNVFTRVTASGWLGSVRLGYVKGSYLFADPGTGLFYISAIEDATTLDALDFATASTSPDKIIAPIDNHGEAWLFGEVTTEVWPYTGAGIFPLERNDGANMETGLLGAFTAQKVGDTLLWLGRDKSGAGIVYKATGFVPVPVSNAGVEQSIQGAIDAGEDMTKAVAFAYQQDGRQFYCLNVPGLDTTWCFDLKSGQWHERAEFVNGEYLPHRAAFHAYCYGKHIVGTLTDDRLYAFNTKRNNNAGAPLVRDRISPHYALPTLQRVTYGPFELDCDVGNGLPDGSEARVMMRSSDDGGKNWGPWRNGTLGAIGGTRVRARWYRNGSSTDRVWQVRCVDDVPFSIIQAAVQGR